MNSGCSLFLMIAYSGVEVFGGVLIRWSHVVQETVRVRITILLVPLTELISG